MLQALYFCRPFREKVLEYKAKNKRTKETLLTCLADLFYSIATQKKKVGSIAPKKFIARLRKEKGKGFFGMQSINYSLFTPNKYRMNIGTWEQTTGQNSKSLTNFKMRARYEIVTHHNYDFLFVVFNCNLK